MRWVGLVGVEPAAELLRLVEGNDREEHVAGQGQVLRGVDPTVSMVIFHPLTGFSFVVKGIYRHDFVDEDDVLARQKGARFTDCAVFFFFFFFFFF
ncbi:MAG: hypothetical protein ACI8UZ_002576, partial [Akkermansiaceae bacterium]